MSVPTELKHLPQWVCWKLETREGKPTKVPYRADGQGMAKTTDPATWSPLGPAWRLWQSDGMNGVGFVVTANDPYVGIDLDKVRDPVSGALAPEAQTLVELFRSYTEVTPSETGIRIWIKGRIPGPRSRKGSIEIYDHERYFTVTGRQLEGSPETIEQRQAELDQLYAELFPPAAERPTAGTSTRLSDLEVLDLARKASNGAKVTALLTGDAKAYSSPSEADQALISLLAFYTQDPGQLERLWRGSRLWRDKAEREDYRRRTIDKALSGLGETYSPADTGGEIRQSAAPAVPGAESATSAAIKANPLSEIYSASDLEGKDIPRPRSVIPGIVNVGLNMLAGKGKLGKSWIALDTALAVALGGKALGSVDVDRNEVLYLALEDNQRRLQERIGMLLGNTRFPSMLHIAHRWPKLDEGGLDALDSWLSSHRSCSFVIVDVWKRIRHKRAANANLYDEDYEHLVGLQATAIKHDVAVLVVHHTRKAVAEDVFDEINGSSGLLAALDTCIILHRTRNEADGEIWVTGRDVEEAHLALRFEGGRWLLLGSAAEATKSKQRREVIEVLERNGAPMTPKEVADALGRQAGSIRTLMWRMVTDGELRRSLNDAYVPAQSRPSVTPSHLVTGGVTPESDGDSKRHTVTPQSQILPFPTPKTETLNSTPNRSVTVSRVTESDGVTVEEAEKGERHTVTPGLSARDARAREEEALLSTPAPEKAVDDVPGWPPGSPGSGRVPSPPRRKDP